MFYLNPHLPQSPISQYIVNSLYNPVILNLLLQFKSLKKKWASPFARINSSPNFTIFYKIGTFGILAFFTYFAGFLYVSSSRISVITFSTYSLLRSICKRDEAIIGMTYLEMNSGNCEIEKKLCHSFSIEKFSSRMTFLKMLKRRASGIIHCSFMWLKFTPDFTAKWKDSDFSNWRICVVRSL